MRHGRLSDANARLLATLNRPITDNDGTVPTELFVARNHTMRYCLRTPRFPLRREVDRANMNHLQKLSGDIHEYAAKDIPGCDMDGNRISPQLASRFLERVMAAILLKLKVQN